MPALTDDVVREALSRVPYPGFSRDIVSFGLLKGVEIDEQRVAIHLTVTTRDPAVVQELRDRATQALTPLAGGRAVEIAIAESGGARLPSAAEEAQAPAAAPSVASRIVGVASGKGGVGKSTVAVNLAVLLAQEGRRVGFLDADVHGPSAPLMFGLEGARPTEVEAGGRAVPLEAHGVKIMSMGFFVGRDDAVIWRGPIVGNFIRQLLTDIAWGELDDLIIDFPPGTGDAQLTISQVVKLAGVVIVTTPNDLALIDALKAVTMFRKVGVPVLGIVENMSYFVCPHCQTRTEIFGRGLVEDAARHHGAPILARVPIDPEVVSESDHGTPVVASRPQSLAAEAYRSVAAAVMALGDGGPQPGLSGFLHRFGRH